jgi:hypothetical protein
MAGGEWMMRWRRDHLDQRLEKDRMKHGNKGKAAPEDDIVGGKGPRSLRIEQLRRMGSHERR